MKKRFLFSVLLITLLVHACGVPQSQAVEQAAPTSIGSQSVLMAEPTQEIETAPAAEASPVAETDAADCLGGETSPIAESIAEEYEFTTYAEVVAWFCNGAEFEDILVALETESQTGTPAEEMLQMLAEGLSWEEIWQSVDLAD